MRAEDRQHEILWLQAVGALHNTHLWQPEEPIEWATLSKRSTAR
jgi:hypothetical protein